MAGYKFTEHTCTKGVKRYSDEAFIPCDPRNGDWRKYLRYVAAGGDTDPWATPEQIEALAERLARLEELAAEREASGAHRLTPTQAKDYIDAQMNAATNTAEMVAAIKRILKRIVVYILR